MYIRVRVKADSRTEEVVKESHDHYVISVREKAERNLANKRIIEILNGMFPGQLVRIIHGHKSPTKLIAIDDPTSL